MKIDVRNDLRQIHIIVDGSVIKIDNKALAMNPDVLRTDPRLQNTQIMIVDNDCKTQNLARKIVI